MGRKKRTTRRPPKQPVDSTPPPTSAVQPNADDDYVRAMAECDRALTTIRRGNHTKALKLIKESCARFKGSPVSSALLYRIQAAICLKANLLFDDTNGRYHGQAIDSARRAVELSPLSVEFRFFYANLLFSIADEEKDFKEVIEECEKALRIKCPVDPYKERLQDGSQWSNGTGSERIGQVQDDLKGLIQRSKIDILCIWMSDLEGPIKGEKFNLIPTGWTTKDPFQERPVQKVQGPGETKSIITTLEDRRNELEARVNAIRLLQQKMELPSAGSEANKSLDPLSGPARGDKVGEKRRVAVGMMPPSIMEKMDLVRNYWNSISEDVKERNFRVTIPEMNRHYAKEKKGIALEVLQDAVDYARSTKGWRFWACCVCKEKFGDSKSLMQHLVQDHQRSFLPKRQSVLPQEVDSKWLERILHFDWKPRDLSLATEMTGSLRPKCGAGNNGNDDCDDRIMDASDSSPDKDKDCEIGCDGFDDVENKDSVCVHDPIAYSVGDDKWLLSDNPGRLKALETISGLLEVLIGTNCLSNGHLTKVQQIAVEALQKFDSVSQLLQNDIDQLPACICFLGEYELRKILEFLRALCQSAGLSESLEVTGFVSQDMEVKERVVLDGDVISIAIDSQSKGSSIAEFNSTVDVAAFVPMNIESLFSWMCAGPSFKDSLRHYAQRSNHGVEILQKIEKEFHILQSMCEKKIDLLGFAEALQSVEDLCTTEGRGRGGTEEFLPRSFHSILQKRLEELQVDETDTRLDCGHNEVDAITRILREAEALNAIQLGNEDAHGLENSKSTGYLHQVDTCIEVTIEKRKDECSSEVNKIDSRIMKIVANMQQLEHELEALSGRDYRVIIVPLIKSFMKIRLEDLAEKDATEKSDAEREALLAELDLDSKETRGGTNNSKHVRGRTKDKKRHKDNRKVKDSKTRGTYENPMINKETDIAGSLTTASNKDHKSYDVPSNDNEVKELGQMRWKAKLAAMDGKLVENLQDQRQLEDINQENGVMEKSEDDGWVTHWRRRGRARWRGQSSKLSSGKDENSVDETLELKGVTIENPPSYSSVVLQGNTIRQSQARRDDEERFQADLEKAIQESLASENLGNAQSAVDENDFNHGETVGLTDAKEVIGTGMQNEVGECNCFLNAIIQSLWHIRRFHDEFLKRSPLGHAHVGDPCVVCALYELFTALSLSAADVQREPVSPTSLRMALSNLYPDFQEGQMNDASEVLGVIFDCLHKSFTHNSGLLNEDESADGDSKGSLDCKDCLVHSLFGLNILQRMNCQDCGLESRHLMYTSFFHNINASALRMMKMMSAQSSFEELLNLVESVHRLACDSDAGGCGKLNSIRHSLSAPPHVFTTVLGWKEASEDATDISATLAALGPEIDISVLYCGIDQKQRHRLVSVVCYRGEHYYSLAYSHDQGRWNMYDDQIVKAIGSWEDVLAVCEESHVQPQILFFEAVTE